MKEFKARLAGAVTSVEELRELPRMRLSADANAVNDNSARASWAATGLVAFSDHVGDGEEPLETIVQDLVTDLMHLCDALGFDWEQVEHAASDNYDFEVMGRE